MLMAMAVCADDGCLKACVKDNVDIGINNEIVLVALCKFKCALQDTKELLYRVADYIEVLTKENLDRGVGKTEKPMEVDGPAQVEVKETIEESVPTLPRPPKFNAPVIKEVPAEKQQISEKVESNQEIHEKLPEAPICMMGPAFDNVKHETKDVEAKPIEKPIVVIENGNPKLAVCPVSFTTEPAKKLEEQKPKIGEPPKEVINLLRKAIGDSNFASHHGRKHFKHLSEADQSSFADKMRNQRHFIHKMMKSMHHMQKNMLGRHMHILRFMSEFGGHNKHHRKHGLGRSGSPSYGHHSHNPFANFFKHHLHH